MATLSASGMSACGFRGSMPLSCTRLPARVNWSWPSRPGSSSELGWWTSAPYSYAREWIALDAPSLRLSQTLVRIWWQVELRRSTSALHDVLERRTGAMPADVYMREAVGFFTETIKKQVKHWQEKPEPHDAQLHLAAA